MPSSGDTGENESVKLKLGVLTLNTVRPRKFVAFRKSAPLSVKVEIGDGMRSFWHVP